MSHIANQKEGTCKTSYIILFLFCCWAIHSLFQSIETVAAQETTVEIKAGQENNAVVAEKIKPYSSSYALVIGIDRYNDAWPQLSNTVKDAGLIAEKLQDSGFDVSLKTNLNSEELQQTLMNFFLSTGKDRHARLFVWFGGHGYTKNGEGFLIATDTPKPNRDKEFYPKALSMKRYLELERMALSNHVFTVLDSCFSDPLFPEEQLKATAAITRENILPARQFLKSGEAGQSISADGTFREMFLRVLQGEVPADVNNDGYLTASEIGMFFMNPDTNSLLLKQTPRYGKVLDTAYSRGDFIFELWGNNQSATKKWTEPQVWTDPHTGMKFVWVDKGCYEMGDIFNIGRPEERPVHEVCVNGFYLGMYEVTQEQYTTVMGKNPSIFKKGRNYPVERVSWRDVTTYIHKLGKMTGNTYRLPTEAEWEYAARSKGRREMYAGGYDLQSVAWNLKNSGNTTQPVGTKSPNNLGIYDMCGNVSEWCLDKHDENYYKHSARNNPQGPHFGSGRVTRGGAYNDIGYDMRTTARMGDFDIDRSPCIGFRLVLVSISSFLSTEEKRTEPFSKMRSEP